MDLFEAIYNRRTIRTFADQNIPDENIRTIINAGIHAPSACDKQLWKFVVIKDKKIIERIVYEGAASFIKKAPIGIVVLYDNQTDEMEYSDHLLSAAVAIQNMLLTAYALGIGACCVCHLPLKRQMRTILKIPKIYDPIVYIALGYPVKKPLERPRKFSVDQVISYNKFSSSIPIQKKNKILLNIKRLLKNIYYLIPRRHLIKPIVDKFFEKKFDDS
ncbi:MAG: nitroreductase family protein [Candidatus Hodarchaeota archaeon]